MIDIRSILKIALPFAGVSDLRVQFDTPKEQVLVNCKQHGQPQDFNIPFREIEAFFNTDQGTAATQSDDQRPGGTATP